MPLAFLFPGQASQFVGMGRDLYQGDPAARARFDLADEVLGFRLTTACFEGPEETLRQTAVTQPAVFTHSIAALELLKARGVGPEATAGHSVGELAALVAAGVLTFEDGLRLVWARARAMQEAGERRPGAMAAVLGLEDADVIALCREAADGEVLQAANFNSPGQVVVSGAVAAVKRAVEAAKAKGARRAIELPVSGAFHSALMEPAVGPFSEALDACRFAAAAVPVYPNVTGVPTTDGAALKELLRRQLTSPVGWTASMRRMAADGFTSAIEVGPGQTLKGLMRRIEASVEVRNAGTLVEIEGFGR